MNRRELLKLVGLVPLVGLFPKKTDERHTLSDERHTLSDERHFVYGQYEKGWSRSIFVSDTDWFIGDLVITGGHTYTVIEVIDKLVEHNYKGVFHILERHVLLDRPLETDIFGTVKKVNKAYIM